MTVTLTVTGADIDGLAVHLDGPELKMVADMARESSTALIFGAPERVSGGIANSAFCVDEQGTLAAVYQKVQLYGEKRATPSSWATSCSSCNSAG